MDPVTRILLSMRHLGRTTNADVLGWAAGRLEAGYDGRHLRMLAGLSGSSPSEEANRRLRQALQELGWDPPAREAALWWRVGFHAREIVQHPKTAPDMLLGHLRELSSLWSRVGYPEAVEALVSLGDAEPGPHLARTEWRAAVVREAAVLRGRLGALP